MYVAEGGELDAPLPQPRVDVIEAVVKEGGYDAVFFAQSVLAADVAAGLAVRLDAGLNWDLVDVRDDGGSLVGVRPALGDSVYVDAGWTSSPAIALFRAGSFEPAETGAAGEIVEASRRASAVLDARRRSRGTTSRSRRGRRSRKRT